MSCNIPFLLEIGTEEIPARFFETALPQLMNNAANILEKNRIEFSDIRCHGTPRRLVLSLCIINPFQKSIVSEVTGPPVKAAFDADNRPTRAAEGFARSQGVRVSDLKIKKTERGEYVAAVKEIKGEKVSKVLPSIVPEIITSIHFPKSMRWGHHTMRYARPIRWLLCLLGDKVVRFELDGIRSGRYSYGHRLLANRRIKIDSPKDFEKELKRHSVIVDPARRKEMIEKGIRKLAQKSGTKSLTDEELLRTVNYLVEYPCPVLCSFPDEYLFLPEELLITVMKDHQKYFALKNRRGKLSNKFVVISNTNSRIASTVRAGAEKVIRARFEDARFYYNEDTRKTLRQRLDDLKQVTFHEKIGTVYEKVERIKAIAEDLCRKIDPALMESVLEAAELCKSDLTTGVVREFPELQGIIGYYYALNEKLPEQVALSIKEHYKPLHAGDTVPSTEEGRIVSMADKIDSIAAFFSQGMIPTGSEDPYALRRQAQGIVQILLSSGWRVTIDELIDMGAAGLGGLSDDTRVSMASFFTQRVEFVLSSMGYGSDVIQSLLKHAVSTPLDELKKKAGVISRFKKSGTYSDFLFAIKRTKNILPGTPLPDVSPALFSEAAERTLHERHGEIRDMVNDLADRGDYASALDRLAMLTGAINEFFDTVLVMDRDERIRDNRLALLNNIWNTALNICDFSRLAEK